MPAGQDHDVDSAVFGELRLVMTKAFTHQSFEPVAPGGPLADLDRHRQAEPGAILAIGPAQDPETAVLGNFRTRENAPKLCRSGESRRSFKCRGSRFHPLVRPRVPGRSRGERGIGHGPGGPRRKDAPSGAEALATLAATRVDHGATALGGHTRTKSVATGTLQSAWLKCTFHDDNLDSIPGQPWAPDTSAELYRDPAHGSSETATSWQIRRAV